MEPVYASLDPINLINVESYFGLTPAAAVNFYGLVVPALLSSVSVVNFFLFKDTIFDFY